MQSHSLLLPYCSSQGPPSSAGGCCILGRKASTLPRPSRSGTTATAIAGRLHHQSVYKRKKVGANRRTVGGGIMLPLAAKIEAGAGGASVKSRLEDGDGIVIVDHGSRRLQSNAMLHEFVQMYKEETGRHVVEAAHMELAVPTIADAFDRCVEQGATRVIISPYFLFPGRHWDKDIPALAAEAARKHSQVSYLVTAPIGLHKSMVTILQDRMEYCLSQVAGEASECDICKGSGHCKQFSTQESQSTAEHVASSTGNLTPL